MEHKTEKIQSRDAVGIFFATEPLEKAVEELQDAGIAPEDIGMLAEDADNKQKLSHIDRNLNRRVSGKLRKEISAVRDDTLADTVYASIGGFSVVGFAMLGAAIVAAAGIFGTANMVLAAAIAVVLGVIGLTAMIIRKTDAERLREQVDRGHMLLFARVHDADQERRVIEVLSRYSGARARIVGTQGA